MRYLILSVTLFVGCGSPEPGNHVVRAGAEEFVSSHRLMPDQAKRKYAGRLVQIYLPPGTHSCDGTTLKYRSGFQDVPPLICFECREEHEKASSDDAVLVTGRYVGIERDSIRRGGGIDWCIYVKDCSVTRLSQNRP